MEKHGNRGCKTCADVTEYESTAVCQECRSVKPVFERVIAFGIYEGVLKEIIHHMKFKKIRRLAIMLGKALGQLELPPADSIIPVPLDLPGLRHREFNQAAIMAKELSRIKKIPLSLNSLRKARETLPQSSLPKSERKENVKGAFFVVKSLSGERIILVDDVVTTAATVNECARTLKNSGAASITVVTAARAWSR